jgi:hypothetical protein
MSELSWRNEALTISVVDDLERAVKATGFKHPDFWDRKLLPIGLGKGEVRLTASDFDKAGDKVKRISAEEAQDALEAYDDE